MGRKDQLLNQLDRKALLRMAKSVSRSHVNGKANRQQLVRIVKESLSIHQIKSAKANGSAQKTKFEAFLVVSIVLLGSLAGISALLVSGSRLAATAIPSIEWSTVFDIGTSCALYSVRQTSDGGYVLLGQQYQDAYINGSMVTVGVCLLMKTYPNGTLRWTRAYADGIYCIGFSIMQTGDLGYVIAGGSYGEDYMYGAWLMKTDADGYIEWKKGYGAGCAAYAQQTSEGGYIIVGTPFPYSSWGVRLVKTDSNGNEQWSKTYGNELEAAYFVRQTSDDGYVVAGTGTAESAWLMKTDEGGDILWHTMIAGVTGIENVMADLTYDGGCVIIGKSLRDYPIISYAIAKMDRYGSLLWNKTYGTDTYPNYIGRNEIHQTLDGGFIVDGLSLLKLNSQGNKEWEVASYTDVPSSPPTSAQQTSDGGYIVGGYGANAIWLVKLEGSTQQYPMSTHIAVFAVAALAVTASTVFLGLRQKRRLNDEVKPSNRQLSVRIACPQNRLKSILRTLPFISESRIRLRLIRDAPLMHT